MSKLTKALTAAAGNAGAGALYAEDVFSTYLYEGTGATQSINNGIDLDGEGGMTWIKCRNTAFNNVIFDTERGAPNALLTNTTDQNISFYSDSLTSFNLDGFSLGADTTSLLVNNGNNRDYCSWSFRKAEKFFDVVTYTGTGTPQTIAHNLGVAPAFIITKKTSSTSNWATNDPSQANPWSGALLLNSTNAFTTASTVWNDTAPTDSVFTVGTSDATNLSGQTYVAYLFASDAGGFGDDGSENIIKCGSYTGNGATGQEINLGFEAQWVLVKSSTNANSWYIVDLMRGMSYGGFNTLSPNSSAAEVDLSGLNRITPTATGFSLNGDWSGNENGWGYIYIAIRRPMKTPEAGTEVFSPVTSTGTGSARTLSGSFPTDLTFMHQREATDDGRTFAWDRLRGASAMLQFTTTAAEAGINGVGFDVQNGMDLTSSGFSNFNTAPYITYLFKRATGFMDVVAYSGDGAATQDITHNLGVSPDFIVVKKRTGSATQWPQWASAVPNYSRYLNLTSGGFQTGGQPYYVGQSVSSTTFRVSTDGSPDQSNGSGKDYIAYLFATLAGVSKVGSVVHSGTTNVDCGFSAGARFVMVKRTDATGDWYYWDSARGIVAGNDPYFRSNVDAADVTNTDYIDPLSSGFTLTSSFTAGTYIFLAIAQVT